MRRFARGSFGLLGVFGLSVLLGSGCKKAAVEEQSLSELVEEQGLTGAPSAPAKPRVSPQPGVSPSPKGVKPSPSPAATVGAPIYLPDPFASVEPEEGEPEVKIEPELYFEKRSKDGVGGAPTGAGGGAENEVVFTGKKPRPSPSP